jgi:predicted Zn-dependent peptidase
MHIFAGVDPDKLPKALRVLMRELSKLVAAAVTPRALKAACEYVLGAARMSLEAPASQMTGMAECLLFYERFIPAGEYEQRLRAVTPAQVHTLAKQIFHPANLTAALVGPVPEQEAIGRMLVMP